MHEGALTATETKESVFQWSLDLSLLQTESIHEEI